MLAELDRANLITEHAPGRFTFHDLLRAYAADQAHAHDSGADRNAALQRMLDHYLHSAQAPGTCPTPTSSRPSPWPRRCRG